MSWMLFGNGVVAVVFLCALCAICGYALCILGRKGASFLVVFVTFSVVATINAQKTNNVPPNMNSPLPQIQQGGGSFQTGLTGFSGLLPHAPSSQNHVNLVNPVQTTAEDVARGWRVESVTTNAAVSYAMPANATIVGNFHVHGAASSFGNNVIEFGGLSFPLGTNNASFSSFWHFVDGRIRPTPRDAAREICAVGAPMSAVPGRSRLWTAEEQDGARVITWESFFLGGDTNCPVNAQIRLYASGDFTTRSNEVETVCRRVNPDDWDGDGIPNDEDVNPCSSGGDFFGPNNDLPEGANSNAYCTVSVVATGPDALITFEGDKPSNYSDPRFIAKTGATNEVVILVGKTYTISSNWPFEVVGVSDPETEVWPMRSAGHRTSVCRPVTITASAGNPFSMYVAPSNLGGAFTWNPSGCSCTLSGSGSVFSWSCPPDCTCCGCSVGGSYSYEGYALPATSGVCICHYDEGHPGPSWEETTGPLAASVSATFSKSAVIFEDPYENMPGQWVGKKSTRTRLNVVANGGPNGATLSVTSANLAKLTRLSGPDLPLAAVSVPAETQVSYSIVYEGVQASATTNDVVVAAMLAENGTGIVSTNTACMTSVRVELEADHAAPANTNLHRHVFGVLESFHYRQYPSSAFAEWYFSEGTQELIPFSPGYIILPPTTNQTSGGDCSFYVTCGDVAYTNAFQMMLPRVEARNPRYNESLTMVQGDAGWLLLHLDLYVGPSYVSFEGIDFVEIPDESGNCPHGGYYNDVTKGGYLSHCAAAGAGRWYTVNSQGYWCSDLAGRGGRYDQPWADGWKEWPIPVGWGIDERLRAQFDRPPTTQKFTLTVDGTFSIRKYGFEATRDTLNHVMIRGVEGE